MQVEQLKGAISFRYYSIEGVTVYKMAGSHYMLGDGRVVTYDQLVEFELTKGEN
jgi:hypothetical protein